MSMTHWKKLTDPDYLGAYAFEPDQEITATIQQVAEEGVTGPDGKREMCIVAHFEEPGIKPLILNATNCKLISRLYRTPFIEAWIGKKITLRVQAVKAFGETVDAVRVKPEIPKDFICADCSQPVQPYGNKSAAELAAYTQSKYGRILCSACAEKVAAAK